MNWKQRVIVWGALVAICGMIVAVSWGSLKGPPANQQTVNDYQVRVIRIGVQYKDADGKHTALVPCAVATEPTFQNAGVAISCDWEPYAAPSLWMYP